MTIEDLIDYILAFFIAAVGLALTVFAAWLCSVVYVMLKLACITPL